MIEFLLGILADFKLFFGVCALILFGLTEALKIPIKWGTSHIAKDNIRKIVNKTVCLVPIALGFAIMYFYDKYYLCVELDWFMAIFLGISPITIYAFIETKLGKKISNIYETEEGKEIVGEVNKIIVDKKVTKDEVKQASVKITKDLKEQISEALNKQ